MSRKPDDWDLDYIHQIAEGSQKIQDLVKAKSQETIELQNKQNIKYKKPNMALSPKGDIRLPKVHKQQTMDDKTLNKKIEQSRASYDIQIKQEMDNLVEHPDHEPIKNLVHDMDAKELSTLSEKGIDAYKQDKHAEKNIDQSLKLDFYDKNQFKHLNKYDDFTSNYEDISRDKSPSINDEYE